MTKRIMIVDDDPDIIYILKTLLRREGYYVIEAYSGEECLYKVEETSPDLILLDIMMPGIDGWEVCRRIKENRITSSILVSILSIRREGEDIEKSFKYSHADGHLKKPIDMEELLSTVKTLLREGNA